jgi:hypothetical protein
MLSLVLLFNLTTIYSLFVPDWPGQTPSYVAPIPQDEANR